MAEAAIVDLIETVSDRLQIARRDLLRGDRHFDRELLAFVAQVKEALESHRVVAHALGRKHFGAFIDHIGKDHLQLAKVQLRQCHKLGAHIIVADVTHQHSERREVRRQYRNDDGRNVKLARDRHGVNGTCATHSDHHEIARVEAALD